MPTPKCCLVKEMDGAATGRQKGEQIWGKLINGLKRDEVTEAKKKQRWSHHQSDGEIWRRSGRWDRVGGQGDSTLSYSSVVKSNKLSIGLSVRTSKAL